MEIVVTGGFMAKLIKHREFARSQDIDKELSNTRKIINLLKSSAFEILTDKNEEELTSIFKDYKIHGSDFIRSLEECIVRKQIRSCLKFKKEYTSDDSKSFIFRNNDLSSIVDESLITVDASKDKWNLPLKIVSDQPFKGEYNKLKSVLPKCNCLFYIDPFISAGSQINLDEFKKLLGSFNGNKKVANFHLTVLSSAGRVLREKGKRNGYAVHDQEHIDALLNVLKESGMDFQLYLAEKFPERFNDRVFFTNYYTGNFGHPDRPTRFSLNSMAILDNPQLINESYKAYKYDLESWSYFIKNITNQVKSTDSSKFILTSYGNLDANRIFKNL